MKKEIIFAVAAAFIPTTSALAAGFVDARAAGGSYEEKFDGEKLELENSGFEFRARVDATPQFSVRAQLTRLKGDDVDIEGETFDLKSTLTIFRAGGAYDFTSVGSNGMFFGAAEYANVKTKARLDDFSESDSDSGAVLSLGFRDAAKSSFLWSAELGAVALKDNKGATLDLTLGYRFSANWAIVGSIQSYAVEEKDEDTETTLGIGTLGIRGSF